MAKASVSDYLERAREIASLADKKSGEEKRRLLEIAEAWLKLAEDSAAELAKSHSVTNQLQSNIRPNSGVSPWADWKLPRYWRLACCSRCLP